MRLRTMKPQELREPQENANKRVPMSIPSDGFYASIKCSNLRKKNTRNTSISKKYSPVFSYFFTPSQIAMVLIRAFLTKKFFTYQKMKKRRYQNMTYCMKAHLSASAIAGA